MPANLDNFFTKACQPLGSFYKSTKHIIQPVGSDILHRRHAAPSQRKWRSSLLGGSRIIYHTQEIILNGANAELKTTNEQNISYAS